MKYSIPALLVFYTATRIVKAIRIFIFDGRVIRIKDGDGFIIRRWFCRKFDVRMAEIDAPELSQKGGKEAKAKLAELIPVGSLVTLERYGKSKGSRGRLIAHVHAGRHVNHLMVISGHAWRYKEYSKDDRLSDIQRYAKRKKQSLGGQALQLTLPQKHRAFKHSLCASCKG